MLPSLLFSRYHAGMDKLRASTYSILRWSERYTKTDMVYLASGGFWLVLEQAVGIALSMSLAIAFGHFASKDMYGNYKYVLSLAAMFGAISLSGLGDAMSQSVARGLDGTLVQSFKLQIKWSLPFVLLSLGASAYYGFLGNGYLASALIIVAFLQPLLSALSPFAGFFFAQKDFARGSLSLIGTNTFTFIAMIAALFLGERAIILVGTYFLAKTIASGYFFWKARTHARNTITDPELLHYSSHLSVMNILAAIADKFDSIIIFSLLGPVQLATYAFAGAAPEQLKGVLKNFYGLSLPKLTGRPLEELRVTLWRKILLLSLFTFACIGLYILIAPLLFRVFFPVYLDSVQYSQWYALSIVFSAIPPMLLASLTAHKKTRALYIVTNGPSIILIASILILVPLYGIMGAVIAQIIYRAGNAAIVSWQFMKS